MKNLDKDALISLLIRYDNEIAKLQAENERWKKTVKQVADKMEFSMQIELVGCIGVLRQTLADSEADAPKEATHAENG